MVDWATKLQEQTNSVNSIRHNLPRAKIMFYCQSSLGVGHTMRSLRLVRGMSDHFDVCFYLIDQIIQIPPELHGHKLSVGRGVFQVI